MERLYYKNMKKTNFQNVTAYHRYWCGQKKLVDQRYLQTRVLRTLRNLFEFILKKEFGKKILDLGCGDGSFVRVCNENNITARGIDISDGINFECDKLPYEDDSFDIVLLYSIIEHIENPDNILCEIKRVLRKNGFVIIITHNFELSNWLLCGRDFYNDPTHRRPYNRVSIKKLMTMYEFSKCFLGLWTVCKSPFIWRLPEKLQFYYGAVLPFPGLAKFVPPFLKGRSKSMLCVFENGKNV